MSDPNEPAYNSTSPQSIDVNALDGEAKAVIEVMLGLERAPCGDTKFIIRKDHIYGYGSDDGIDDAQGRTWWLGIKCPDCGAFLPRNKWSTLL